MQYLVRGELLQFESNNNNNNFNNFIEKITPIITSNDLEIIQGYIKNISRSNLINIIGVIRNNKYNFNSLNQTSLYNKIIDELYKELNWRYNKIEKQLEQTTNQTNKIEKVEKVEKVENKVEVKAEVKVEERKPNKDFKDCYDEIFDSINNLEDMEKPEYKNYVLENMYGLKMLLQVNEYKKNNCDNSIVPKPYYELVSEPVFSIYNEDKKKFIISFVKFLLKIIENINGRENKVICVLTMYDFMFRNYDFLTNHGSFTKTFYNKIIEMIVTDSDIFVDMSLKYYNKPNIVFIWRDHIKILIDNA